METQKIDFKEVVILDLMEHQILLPTNYQRDLGNSIYIGNDGIETADLGRKLFYAGRDATDLLLTESEIKNLIRLIDVFPWLGKPLHEGIKDYLNNKLQVFTN